MPSYTYTVLSCHLTSISESGTPLILLLVQNDRKTLEGWRTYLHPAITDILSSMPEGVQDWMMSLLEDLRFEQGDEHARQKIGDRYSGLSIGPLRTEVSGVIESEDYSAACRILPELLYGNCGDDRAPQALAFPRLYLSVEVLGALRLKRRPVSDVAGDRGII
jgi:hypothetical protein